MRISIAEAESQLTDLVRLAKQGEEVVLTENGHAVIQLAPVRSTFIADPLERDRLIRQIQEDVRRKNLPPGPDAARGQDFLYDDYGLTK